MTAPSTTRTFVIADELKTRGTSVGDRVGMLTVESKAGATRLGVLWLCRCECGRTSLRTSAALNFAARKGIVAQCINCSRRSRSEGLSVNVMLRRWLRDGTLWSFQADDRLCRSVHRALCAEFGPVRPDMDGVTFLVDPGYPPTSRLQHGADGAVSDGPPVSNRVDIPVDRETDRARSEIGRIAYTTRGPVTPPAWVSDLCRAATVKLSGATGKTPNPWRVSLKSTKTREASRVRKRLARELYDAFRFPTLIARELGVSVNTLWFWLRGAE